MIASLIEVWVRAPVLGRFRIFPFNRQNWGLSRPMWAIKGDFVGWALAGVPGFRRKCAARRAARSFRKSASQVAGCREVLAAGLGAWR